MTTALAERNANQPPANNANAVQLSNLADLITFANLAYKAGAPIDCNKPEAVAMKIAYGLEIGLKPAQSLGLIKFVNGKPSVDGEGGLILLRRHPLLESFDVGVDGQGDQQHGWITTKRRGEDVTRKTTFTVAEAKRAELWNKKGPWQTYPERMLKWRAIGFHLRDWWTDCLGGFMFADEGEEPQPQQEQRQAIASQEPKTLDAEIVSITAAPQPGGVTSPATTAEATATPMVTEDQLAKFAQHRRAYLTAKGVDADDKTAAGVAWSNLLSKWDVTSAKKLTKDQADAALAAIYQVTHATESMAAVFGGPGSVTSPTA